MEFTAAPQVNLILETLQQAGFEAYIVGGCVRDMLMGRQPHDFDVTTSAKPEQVKALFKRVIETGLKHGTVTVLADGEPVEVTTFRVEGGYSDGRHPDFVEFTGSLEEDLTRRDFTMNALAWSPQTGVQDFFGGRQDIERGVIRAVGDADKRFKEDALRILRALRFASVLGFEIEQATEQALYDNKELLARISAERIQVELTKLLTGAGAGKIICRYGDIIGTVIPEVLEMKDFNQQNPHHIYDVLKHSAAAVDVIEPMPHLRWAAFLHDVAKPRTFTVDEAGTGHFYGHAARGEEMARVIMRRLRFDNETTSRVVNLVKHHDLQIELTTKAVKRALNNLGEETFRDLILLKRADNLAQNPDYFDRQEYYDQLENLLAQIIEEKQCFSLKNLAVDGKDLIAAGITDGREIGRLLKEALAEVIEGKINNEKEVLLAWVQNRKTYVIGHKNPDTDSVCSAMGLARLRGLTAAAAGKINDETRFVLEYFGAEEPSVIDDITDKSVILVDMNEKSHGAQGIDQAYIREIVDHHVIVAERTVKAEKVTNKLLGSTAAIVYQLYCEEGLKPDSQTAGLLLGAVISDTLFFKSPTSTEEDRLAAEELAKLAGMNNLDMADFAGKMFAAGSDISGKSVREIFYQDYKVFSGEGVTFGAGALTVPDLSQVVDLVPEMLEFMASEPVGGNAGEPEFLAFMVSGLMDEKTLILCADGRAEKAVKQAFKDSKNALWQSEKVLCINEIISRKKQFVPAILASAGSEKAGSEAGAKGE